MAMRAIRSGELRQRVTIEQPDGEVGDYNQSNRKFETWRTDIPASIMSVSGGEAFRGLKVDATTTHAVKLRHLDGLTAAMRLDWGGRKLNILQILDPDGRRHTLDVMCKESTSA